MKPGSNGEHVLQQQYDSADRADAFYDAQMLDHLNERMVRLIQRQEMMFVATADKQGESDCSFRAGLPGFVMILDNQTLIYPEYRGNGVYASLGNVSENPHIGLLFVDFLETTIGLHVNGKADVLDNEQLLQRDDIPDAVQEALQVEGGRHPERWVRISVEEAYIHCSKHVPRLAKVDKTIHWGSDDESCKGGDFFAARKFPGDAE
jgi:predicted pyridoxine 5'-phosphate oxidase superfamily flavin-nucleotide-binding protein